MTPLVQLFHPNPNSQTSNIALNIVLLFSQCKSYTIILQWHTFFIDNTCLNASNAYNCSAHLILLHVCNQVTYSIIDATCIFFLQIYSARCLVLEVWRTSVTSACCCMKPSRSPASWGKSPLSGAAMWSRVSVAASAWWGHCHMHACHALTRWQATVHAQFAAHMHT